MRICRKCLDSKPEEQFSVNRSRSDGLQLRCKLCNAEYAKAWRLKNQGPSKVSGRPKNVWTVEDRRMYLRELRSAPCVDCKNIFPTVCMDFDHLPGEVKLFGIMNGWKWRTWESILSEIKKCEIVCSNCHRIRTEARRCIAKMESIQ